MSRDEFRALIIDLEELVNRHGEDWDDLPYFPWLCDEARRHGYGSWQAAYDALSARGYGRGRRRAMSYRDALIYGETNVGLGMVPDKRERKVSKPRMSPDEFEALLNAVVIALDAPTTTTDMLNKIKPSESFFNSEARRHGYSDWQAAYDALSAREEE